MKAPSYSLKSLAIAAAAIAALLTCWPPYRFQPGPLDQPVGFNPGFWTVAGIVSVLLGFVVLNRVADAARREATKEFSEISD
jgi:hypothetical protein